MGGVAMWQDGKEDREVKKARGTVALRARKFVVYRESVATDVKKIQKKTENKTAISRRAAQALETPMPVLGAAPRCFPTPTDDESRELRRRSLASSRKVRAFSCKLLWGTQCSPTCGPWFLANQAAPTRLSRA